MWSQLTIDDMKLYLSQDELDSLNKYSKNVDEVVNKELDVIADMFRGAFISKSYEIDTREHYIPSSYKHFVCVYARWSLWTRFPMSPSVALDDARKAEYELVKGLLKDAYIGVDKPSWEHSSSNPDNPDNAGAKQGGSIGLPFLRFDEQLWYWGLENKITKCNCS